MRISAGFRATKPTSLLFAGTGHLIDHNRAFSRPYQAIYWKYQGFGAALKSQHFALLRPSVWQALVNHLLEVEAARLAPGEDRLLDVGRQKSEPQ